MFWCCCPSAGGTCGSGSVVETFDNGMPDPLWRDYWYSEYQWTHAGDGPPFPEEGRWGCSTVAGAGAVDGKLRIGNGLPWITYESDLYNLRYPWGRTTLSQCIDRRRLDEQILYSAGDPVDIEYDELMEIYVHGLDSDRDLYDLPEGRHYSWLKFGIFKLIELRIFNGYGFNASGVWERNWWLQWGVDDRFYSSTSILFPVDPSGIGSKLSVHAKYYRSWWLLNSAVVDVHIEVRVSDVPFVDTDWFFEWNTLGAGSQALWPYAWLDTYTVPITLDTNPPDLGGSIEGFDAPHDLHDTESKWVVDDWNVYNTPP